MILIYGVTIAFQFEEIFFFLNSLMQKAHSALFRGGETKRPDNFVLPQQQNERNRKPLRSLAQKHVQYE